MLNFLIVTTDQQKRAGTPHSPQAKRLLCALDLMELGIEIMRQNILRRNPSYSPAQVYAELQQWICGTSHSNRTTT